MTKQQIQGREDHKENGALDGHSPGVEGEPLVGHLRVVGAGVGVTKTLALLTRPAVAEVPGPPRLLVVERAAGVAAVPARVVDAGTTRGLQEGDSKI